MLPTFYLQKFLQTNKTNLSFMFVEISNQTRVKFNSSGEHIPDYWMSFDFKPNKKEIQKDSTAWPNFMTINDMKNNNLLVFL